MMALINVPNGLQEIEALFGRLPEPDASRRSEWRSDNLRSVKIPWQGGIPYGVDRSFSLQVHYKLVPVFKGLLRDLYTSGYYTLIKDHGGTYNHREKRSCEEMSTHSWGIAWDINVSDNKYGQIPAMPALLVKMFEKHGFVWLGWKHPYDGMHIQFCSGY